MLKQIVRKKKSLYNRRRYWYHLSSTLHSKLEHLTPWDNAEGFNRTNIEPNTNRICVAPSIAHCLTAIPYSPGDKYIVYRTQSLIKASKPVRVFDANVTNEGWITEQTTFIKIGTLNLMNISKREKSGRIIIESASGDVIANVKKVLNWWKKRNPKKYLKGT